MPLETASAHTDRNFTACSTPKFTPAIQYDTPSPKWSSVYYYDEAIHEYTYDKDGKVIETKHLGYNGSTTANCTISYKVIDNSRFTDGFVTYEAYAQHTRATANSKTVRNTVYMVKKVDIYLVDENNKTYTKDKSNGTVGSNVAKDGNPKNSNNSGLVTYVDEKMPQVKCIKTYGNDKTVDCSKDIKKTYDDNFNGKKGQRLTCFQYTDSYSYDSDKVCTVRMYVSDVQITAGPTTTYTGKHHNYECVATFSNGTKRNISGLSATDQNYVWLSYPSNQNMKSFRSARYIGTDWMKNNGYTDAAGKTHKPDSLHDFYPVDPVSRTYIVNCTYFPDANWVEAHYGVTLNADTFKNQVISDLDKENGTTPWHVVKNAKVTVNHVGIDKLWVEVSGGFGNESNPNIYTTKTLVPTNSTASFAGGWNLTDAVNKKTYSPGYWNQEAFNTASWYDFKAFIMYKDGTVRDVTSAEEIHWDSTPWFKGQSKYKTENYYDSGMPFTGLDHRLPSDGWNTIDVEYLHRNVPYGATAYGKTKSTNRLKSRQVKSLDITHVDSPTKAPVTTIGQNDSKVVQYNAWITWTDNTRENWTNSVTWQGDHLVNKGNFDFSKVKGQGQKTTVYAQVKDVNGLKGVVSRSNSSSDTSTSTSYNSNKTNWNLSHDKIEVTISDCSNVEHLAFKCPLPSNYWRIDAKSSFDPFNLYSNPNSNFYPAASLYNSGSWNNENDIYSYERIFPVSGTSSGVGNQ